MKKIWKVLLCIAIISSMLLTSVLAATSYDYPDIGEFPAKTHEIVGLNNVENARDLGGYEVTIEGQKLRIKDKLLFRTGNLHDADVDELIALGVDKDIDLRTNLEVLRKPDVKDDRIKYVPISMLTIPNLLVMETADWRTLLGAITSGIMETWDTNLYRQYIQDPSAYKATQKFFDEVLDSAAKNESVLWHCTAGKDRTGIEAMLLMAALGFDYKTIEEDFLLTNAFYKEKAEASYRKAYDILHIKAIANEFYNYEIVKESWLGISMDVMKRMTGESDNNDALKAYLNKYAGVSDEEMETLRAYYLESAA